MKRKKTLFVVTSIVMCLFLTACLNPTIHSHDGKYVPTITMYGVVMPASKERIVINGNDFIVDDEKGEESHLPCKQFENRIELEKKDGGKLIIHFYPEGDFDCIEFGMVTWKPEERVMTSKDNSR